MNAEAPKTRPPTLLALPTYLADWVSRRARADIQRALAEHGLSTPDFGVLVALDDLGAVSQQQLADGLGADKSHVVRLIDQLEERGLVTRSSHPKDRRRHRIEVTSEGRAVLETTGPVVQAIEEQHLQVLTEDERRILTDLLQRVLNAQDSRQRNRD